MSSCLSPHPHVHPHTRCPHVRPRVLLSARTSRSPRRDVLSRGLTEQLSLPGSDHHDAVLCAMLACTALDGGREVLLGTYGQVWPRGAHPDGMGGPGGPRPPTGREMMLLNPPPPPPPFWGSYTGGKRRGRRPPHPHCCLLGDPPIVGVLHCAEEEGKTPPHFRRLPPLGGGDSLLDPPTSGVPHPLRRRPPHPHCCSRWDPPSTPTPTPPWWDPMMTMGAWGCPPPPGVGTQLLEMG